MERRLILALSGVLVLSAAFADDAWKWTDEDGVVHYSDVPREGAEAVRLSEYNKKTGARIATDTTLSRPEEEPEEFSYETLEILSPSAEETLWNIEGILNVRVAINPNLIQGHGIRIYYDGDAQDILGTSTQLTEVYRGMHTLHAEVLDRTGRVITRSDPVRFYVQQNSIQ
jgi:hypothetical protein